MATLDLVELGLTLGVAVGAEVLVPPPLHYDACVGMQRRSCHPSLLTGPRGPFEWRAMMILPGPAQVSVSLVTRDPLVLDEIEALLSRRPEEEPMSRPFGCEAGGAPGGMTPAEVRLALNRAWEQLGAAAVAVLLAEGAPDEDPLSHPATGGTSRHSRGSRGGHGYLGRCRDPAAAPDRVRPPAVAGAVLVPRRRTVSASSSRW